MAEQLYEDPEFVQRVVQLRDNENKQWKEVGATLSEEYNLDFTPTFPSLKECYNRAVAQTITVEKKANKQFDDFSAELNENYRKVIKTLSRLNDALDKIYDEFETSDMEAMQKYLAFIKLAPQIKATADQILAMVKHHEDRQDKIRIEQKSVVWSTMQVNEHVNKAIEKLVKEGVIVIKKKI